MTGRESVVIDASALLAYVYDEPGGERMPLLAGDLPVMSAVNWCEVVQKALRSGISTDLLRSRCEEAGIKIRPFTAVQAERAAKLWDKTHPLGLSLADRACLAMAITLGVPALTADRTWRDLAIDGLRVELLRE